MNTDEMLAQWARLLRSNLYPLQYTAALHRFLIEHGGFSPGRSREGFIDHYLSFDENTLRFINQFDSAANPHMLSAEYGTSRWYSGKIAHQLVEIMGTYAKGLRALVVMEIRERKLDDISNIAKQLGYKCFILHNEGHYMRLPDDCVSVVGE